MILPLVVTTQEKFPYIQQHWLLFGEAEIAHGSKNPKQPLKEFKDYKEPWLKTVCSARYRLQADKGELYTHARLSLYSMLELQHCSGQGQQYCAHHFLVNFNYGDMFQRHTFFLNKKIISGDNISHIVNGTLKGDARGCIYQ